jgi:hypothetical protein
MTMKPQDVPRELIDVAMTGADPGCPDDAAFYLANAWTAIEAMLRADVAAALQERAAMFQAEADRAQAAGDAVAFLAGAAAALRVAVTVARGPQDAPTAPAQPTTDATRDAETPDGTQGGTGDLSAFRTPDARYLRRAARAMGLPIPEPDQAFCATTQKGADDLTALRDRVFDAVADRCGHPAETTQLTPDGKCADCARLTEDVLDAIQPVLEQQATGDLSALRDRIAQTFMRWHDARITICEHTQFVEFGTAADAVMDVIRPHLTPSRTAPTDDLDALCDRIAHAIRTAVRVNPGPDLRERMATDPDATCPLSGAEAHDAAHAVMPLLVAERERAEQWGASIAEAASRDLGKAEARAELAEAALARTAAEREHFELLASNYLNDMAIDYRAQEEWAQQLYAAWWSARIGRAAARHTLARTREALTERVAEDEELLCLMRQRAEQAETALKAATKAIRNAEEEFRLDDPGAAWEKLGDWHRAHGDNGDGYEDCEHCTAALDRTTPDATEQDRT